MSWEQPKRADGQKKGFYRKFHLSGGAPGEKRVAFLLSLCFVRSKTFGIRRRVIFG